MFRMKSDAYDVAKDGGHWYKSISVKKFVGNEEFATGGARQYQQMISVPGENRQCPILYLHFVFNITSKRIIMIVIDIQWRRHINNYLFTTFEADEVMKYI